MLTNKTHSDFNKWLHSQDKERYFIFYKNNKTSAFFFDMPLSMKYGVYQDFFAFKGIELRCEIGRNVKTNEPDGYDWSVITYSKNGYGGKSGYADTSEEGRAKSLEVANEMYNL